MPYSKLHIGIAVGLAVLMLIVFFGYLIWLNNQPPVLARSETHDPLSGIPDSIKLNPLRDRSSERVANRFLRALREGKCKQELESWEKDYRRKYASFICDSETEHPLVSWEVAEWEDSPPLRMLRYRGTRRASPGQKTTYTELFSVTLDSRDGDWIVTKYEAIY
ncbi:MAG: hypothetical protein JO266_19665 [Acidobacteria bacterium]|nr:hypothetical protein [Acidobacteriota bacterium]MBV9480521.1 hypothetical protein [Acidobacteriota bacterium]